MIKALQEDRIILTRTENIAQEKTVKIILLENEKLSDQLKELKSKLDVRFTTEEMFSRCSECNRVLKEFPRKKARDKVPQYVFTTRQHFYRCPVCKKIFWQGTHWGLAAQYLKQIEK